MNGNPDPTNENIVETLHQQYRLLAPADVKAELLYRCGVAAGESKLRHRYSRKSWKSAAIVVLAFGIGGLAGRFLNQSLEQNGIAKSSPAENATIVDSTTPGLNWAARSSQQPPFKRPENALTVAMDFNRARLALSQRQPPIAIPTTAPETNPSPLSVWMSNSDLDTFFSL